jgi:hypothetical protein
MIQPNQCSEFSLKSVITRLNLQKAISDDFFSEWDQDFPALTELEQQHIDRTAADFHDQSQHWMWEQAVQLVALSPMLSIAGFYREPFRMRAEQSIPIALSGRGKILRGRIDVLVLADRLWMLVIESKEAGFSLKKAIPQALSYMAATPTPGLPAYGLCTNGSHWLFLKLDVQTQEYALSDEFSLYRQGNELGNVLQVLKQLGEIVRPAA